MDTLYDLVETDITAFLNGDLMTIIFACLGIVIVYGALATIKSIMFRTPSFPDYESSSRERKK